MADPALAGYNPSVSLLQGGDNARILPVQGGGGGGALEGYNAGVSVLPQPAAHTEITAVRGGGYEQKGGAFKAAKDLSTSATSGSVKIKLDKDYSLRITDPRVSVTSDAPSAKKDWGQGKFTQEEADMLNALEFTPELLEVSFGKSWLQKLADFLEALGGQQQCLSKMNLLLADECQTLRLFVNKVIQTKYKKALEEVYEQWSVKMPEDSQLVNVLKKLRESTLEEMAAAAAAAAPGEKTVRLDEELGPDELFLGDLHIAYNPDETAKPFSLNYVELDAAKRTQLKNLEKQIRNIQKGTKKRRIRAAKLENIMAEYKRISGISETTAAAAKPTAPAGETAAAAKPTAASIGETAAAKPPAAPIGQEAATKAKRAKTPQSYETRAAAAAAAGYEPIGTGTGFGRGQGKKTKTKQPPRLNNNIGNPFAGKGGKRRSYRKRKTARKHKTRKTHRK